MIGQRRFITIPSRTGLTFARRESKYIEIKGHKRLMETFPWWMSQENTNARP